jgi:uncharacterized protein (TIGR03067 family)
MMSNRSLLLGLILAGILGCERGNPSAQPAVATASENPVQQLQGEWVAVQGEFQGKPVQGPDAETFLSQYKLIFEGNGFTSVSPDMTTKGTFKVDASTKPLALRMLLEEGDEVAAIFEFRGGRLFFCATEPGDAAPKEFKTSPASSALFTVYRKVR